MYVTIEGIDGSGKSTLHRALGEYFRDSAVTTKAPNEDNVAGRAVREALKRETAPLTDLFLFYADHHQNLRDVILPALKDDMLVISDRGKDSMFAYQAPDVDRVPGIDNPWDFIRSGYAGWDRDPDLTLYLDVSVETASQRMSGDEKYEDFAFLEGVKERYEVLARNNPDRFVWIDAEQDESQVIHDALEALEVPAEP